MGNLCKTCQLCNKERKNITILLTGLDNAGKTTIVKTLAGEPTDSVLKTVGFSLVILYYHGFKITMYDLGGSSNIRDIWNKYYMDAHGLIYVVDASDSTKFEESKRIFVDLLSHENISGKHVLLLAHKQDKDQALDELEIVEQLNVEYIVNKYRCPTRVEASTTIGLESSKIDKGLKNGFRWLLDSIIQNYKIINERVQRDMENYAFIVERSREEWRRRTKLKDDTTEDIAVVENGNPFQPINTLIGKASQENVNGLKPIMVDNFVEELTKSSKFSQKTSIHTRNSPVSTITQPFKGQKKKLTQRFRRHRKKFGRFNKTAPMPIDTMMRRKSLDKETRKTPNHAGRSLGNYTERKRDIPKNYLIRRPATAPPKINFFKLKVETAWNLSAPLESSQSVESQDDRDIVSYF